MLHLLIICLYLQPEFSYQVQIFPALFVWFGFSFPGDRGAELF